ncbi:uncharacterized protein LOC134399124 isoform X2 [Elgaria multicarinata webbii]
MKQRRKRKRNRKLKGATIKAMEKKSGGQLTPSDEDSSQSGQGDSEDNEKSAFLTEHPNMPKEVCEDGSVNANDLKPPELEKRSFLVSNMADPQILGNSLKIDALAGVSSEPLMSLPFVPNENIPEQTFSNHLPNRILEGKNNVLECNNHTSLKLDHSGTESSTVLANTEDKDIFADIMLELDLESKLLSYEEVTIPDQHGASENNKKNTWAFFSFDSADKQTLSNSAKGQSYLTWPEDTLKIIYEQRPKKVRKPKQVFSERTAELIIDKSNKVLTREGDLEVLHENNGLTDCALPSPLTENIHNMPCIVIGQFPTESGARAHVSSDVSPLASAKKQGRLKRIFKLAPNFDLPRQIPTGKDEEVLKDIDVLTEQEEISNEEATKKNKQSLGCYEYPASSSYGVVVKSSHFDAELLCKDSNELSEESQLMEFSTKVAAAPIQICTSASHKPSIPSEQQIVGFDQTVLVTTEENKNEVTSGISTTQPDILCSVKTITECLTDSAAENLENIQQINETERTKYSQIKDDKDTLSTKPNILGLPLSQGFAIQLVELFGSPGVPLDTLLPDDYVVPLDWATSKEIYLQWKTSVEKKQKNNIMREDSSLLAGATSLDDSNKDGQERQESSEVNPEMHLEEMSLL